MVRRSARAHVVFGVNFEEVDRARAFENVAGVLRLQSRSGADHLHAGFFHDGRWIGASDPGPCGVVVVVQLSLGTSFQELP